MLLWPPHAKSWLIGKDSDAGKDWGQEEKGTTEDEMAGWHHQLIGRESQWTPGVGDGQGGLACCNSWGRKESDTTERLIWSDLIWDYHNWPRQVSVHLNLERGLASHGLVKRNGKYWMPWYCRYYRKFLHLHIVLPTPPLPHIVLFLYHYLWDFIYYLNFLIFYLYAMKSIIHKTVFWKSVL